MSLKPKRKKVPDIGRAQAVSNNDVAKRGRSLFISNLAFYRFNKIINRHNCLHKYKIIDSVGVPYYGVAETGFIYIWLMNRPKVSVSLITYNHEKYIAACLDSVVKQLVDFDWEIIVSDDCSKDRTPEIVSAYALKYPNLVKPILRKSNLGLVKNAISTIEACTGQYIALMEGDDYWIDDSKLQMQADYLDKNPDCAFCFTNQFTFFEEEPGKQNIFFTHENKPPEKFDLDFFINNNTTIPNNTKMFRREVQPVNFPDWYFNSFSWDWALHILHALHGKMGYIDRVTLAYRRHAAAVFMSRDRIKVLLNGIATSRGINKELNYKYDYRFKSLWWEYHELSFAYLANKEFANFITYYAKYLASPHKPSLKLRDDLWLFRSALRGRK